MRTIKTTTVVPEQMKTETTYACDHCAWVSDDGCWGHEKNAKLHFAQHHAFTKKTTAGFTTFFWFETLENYRLFHEDSDESSGGDFKETNWKGPGWYGMDHYIIHGEDDVFAMRSLAYFERQAREEAEKSQKILAELQALKETI